MIIEEKQYKAKFDHTVKLKEKYKKDELLEKKAEEFAKKNIYDLR